MVATQIMQFVDTDGSDSSSEGRAPNERPHAQNLRFLRQNLRFVAVYDSSMVSMGRKIGGGSQGCIFEAKFYTPFSFKPFNVVVKKFKPFDGVSQGHFPLRLFSPQCYNVYKPLGAFFEGDALCIIMSRYSCDLRAHIDSCIKDLIDEEIGYVGPPFEEAQAIFIMLQLAMGLKALHECGIYHRDLKAANILVRQFHTGVGRRFPYVKLKRFPYVELGIADFESSKGILGTEFYRAPEVFQYLRTRIPLSEDQWLAADVYSFGMVCYEVLTGRIPFAGHRRSDYDLVLKGGRPELPDHVPEFFKDIIRRCWHANPSIRPSWTEIIQVLIENSSGDIDSPEDFDRPSLGSMIDNLMDMEWSVGSSIESVMVQLKQTIQAHIALDASTSKGFANHVYWAEEFLATAEEYVSKFEVESPSENSLLCKWPEYLERKRLLALLQHKMLAYSLTYRLSMQWKRAHLIYESNFDSEFEVNFFQHPDEIPLVLLLGHVLVSIGEVEKRVACTGEVDEEMTWIGKLLFFHAFIKWQLWNEVVFQGVNLPLVNPEASVEDFILHICLRVVTMVDTYLYVLALFTYEPIVLCLQYGLYRINGCSSFLYRSSGYRICRLQRAWVNYTRYNLLTVALVLSFLYLVSTYKWKGVFGWILIPFILRSSPYYWRRAILSH